MNQFEYDIDDFLEYCQCQNLRRKTLKSYEQTLRIFARYMADIMKVTDAKETKELQHIGEYVKYLQS